MSDVDLSPTGEILLGCMNELIDLRAKHTALVEAVSELMNLDYEDNFDYDVFDKAWKNVERNLADAQEET